MCLFLSLKGSVGTFLRVSSAGRNFTRKRKREDTRSLVRGKRKKKKRSTSSPSAFTRSHVVLGEGGEGKDP